MASPNPSAIGAMICASNQPTQTAQCLTRKVSFVFYCAPRDDNHLNPMYTAAYPNDATHTGVTDSAPYLTGMPYVVVDADTGAVIYPYNSAGDATAVFPVKTHTGSLHDGTRFVHALPPINVPDHVTRIALHIANDAYRQHRNFRLFPWTVPDAAHSKVHIYEVRSDLQDRFVAANHLGTASTENAVVARPGANNEYYGCLNGDLWLKISHEFTAQEVAQLCPPETLSRPLPSEHPEAQPANMNYTNPSASGTVSAAQQPPENGGTQMLLVDWTDVLRPIYHAGAGSRSMDAFSVRLDGLGITVKFAPRAVANAVNTSNRTTVQDALRRTSPRAFAAALKAAWRLHIDTIDLSSSWRPMLGSRLHRMGVALDIIHFDDLEEGVHFVVHNHGAQDRNRPFPQTAGGQKLAALYAELTGDHHVESGMVYTPWVQWVAPHDSHMHLTVKLD